MSKEEKDNVNLSEHDLEDDEGKLVKTDAPSKGERQQSRRPSSMNKSKIKEQQLIKAYGQNMMPVTRPSKSQQFFRTAEQFDRKIVHDQVNRSGSKQLFTFAKAQRFSKARESYCQRQFYDSQLESQLARRGTNLGYGNKSDFTKCDKYIPGPTNYDIRSTFEVPKAGGKFGLGREDLSSQGLLATMPKNPGPGSYEPKMMKTSSGFSLGIRTTAKHIYIESTTPPPGTYDIGGLNAFGRYTLCKHPGSGAAVFSPTSGHDQFIFRQNRIPGPGTYNPPGDIKDSNQHIPSQYIFRSGPRFGTEIRKTQELPRLKTPGPGTYSLPSEFGDWDFPPLVGQKALDQNSRFNRTDGFKPSDQ